MYCAVPFNRLHVYVTGEATLCYGQTWTSKGVGNVLVTDPMAIWKSEEAAEFRKSILDQSFRYCTDCRCPEMVESRDPPQNIDLSTIGCLVLSYDYTCNLSCPSCRTENHKGSPLSSSIHKRLMESGVLKHVRLISVMGSGEPLASVHFWNLIEDLKTGALEVHPELALSITSNGVLLTPRQLEKILSSGKKVTGVEISVDAAKEETYLINRRGGNWNILMTNLSNLVSVGIPLRMNFVVQANNFSEMPRFVELASRIGADYVRFDAINNWGAYTQEEFLQRAVHYPSHPKHQQLKDVLQDPALKNERVHMAQLSAEYFDSLSPLKTLHAIGTKSHKPR